jgi:hypothetical protein
MSGYSITFKPFTGIGRTVQTEAIHIDLAAVFSQSGQVASIQSSAVVDPGVQDQARTPLEQAERDLDSLLDAENVNGYKFKPTGRAYHYARRRLLAAYDIMGLAFSCPSIDSDGEGGIDLEWTHEGRTVILSNRGKAAQRDYIYFEDGRSYGGDDYSPEYLRDRLNWLIHEQQ